MAVTKNAARQDLKVAYVDLTYADLTTAVDAEVIELPYNAVLVGGSVTVTTAFNSATSDVIIVGDSGDDNRYLTSTSIAATGRTAITPSGLSVAGKNITVEWTGSGTAATAGALRLMVTYYVPDRMDTTYG